MDPWVSSACKMHLPTNWPRNLEMHSCFCGSGSHSRFVYQVTGSTPDPRDRAPSCPPDSRGEPRRRTLRVPHVFSFSSHSHMVGSLSYSSVSIPVPISTFWLDDYPLCVNSRRFGSRSYVHHGDHAPSTSFTESTAYIQYVSRQPAKAPCQNDGCATDAYSTPTSWLGTLCRSPLHLLTRNFLGLSTSRACIVYTDHALATCCTYDTPSWKTSLGYMSHLRVRI